MGWADRLRAALAADPSAPFSAECAHANSANSANRPAEAAGGGLLALSALLAEGDSPEKAAAGTTAPPANDPTPATPPPSDPADLLRHIRDVLHCRVSLAGEVVTIRPTHRCPPPVLAAVVAALPAVKAILQAEDADSLSTILGAGGGGADAVPFDLPTGRVLPGGDEAPTVQAGETTDAEEPPARPAAPSIPPDDLVERLAAALAAPRPWQRIVGDPARAMAYFRGMARNRLDRLDPVARGLRVSSAEAEALASGTGR